MYVSVHNKTLNYGNEGSCEECGLSPPQRTRKAGPPEGQNLTGKAGPAHRIEASVHIFPFKPNLLPGNYSVITLRGKV
jgi:hypothetical protein